MIFVHLKSQKPTAFSRLLSTGHHRHQNPQELQQRTTSTNAMAPLNFFMTRLLFVEQNKADSLKAKSDKAEVVIVVDNPKILPEKSAKSLPTLPAPPAAPESPVAVEGWNGPRIGGWTNKEDESTIDAKMGKLSLRPDPLPDGDDHTEYTQESASTVDETTTRPVVAPVERPTQLFPTNAARGANPSASSSPGPAISKKQMGGSSGGVARKLLPSLKKKASKTNSIRQRKDHGSSPSSSASED